jgi:hypothetical protein
MAVGKAYNFKDDPDHQTAAWANRDVFVVSQVSNGDFKAVATRARVMVDFECRIVRHVLDFDLIIYVLGHFGKCVRRPGALCCTSFGCVGGCSVDGGGEFLSA